MNARARRGEPGALVLGGDYMIELGLARSLGRHGIEVRIVGAQGAGRGRHSVRPAAASRYCSRTLPWPSEDAEERVRLLLRLADQGLESWTLLPSGDNESRLVATHHELLGERFVLTTPPWETLRWAFDKRNTYALAAEVGVAYPRTWFPADRRAVADADCSFPVVLKPSVKVVANEFTRARAWAATSRNELLELYDRARRLVPPETILVQERIAGGGEAQFSYAALYAEGKPVAELTAQRVRQHPPDFGTASTCVVTVECDPVENAGRRLLERIGYTGVVEAEFKYDDRDGLHKLLDLNARPWVWHPLGARAGVDFPYLLWQLAHGQAVEPARARAGERWLHLALDVPSAVRSIRAGRLSTRTYLASLTGRASLGTMALDDPLPAAAELLLLGSWAVGTRLAGGRGGARPLVPATPHAS